MFVAETPFEDHSGPHPYRCIADNKCTYSGSERRSAAHHVIRRHTDESRVPHGCSLCGYKCENLTHLKSHRNWYNPHIRAMKRAAAGGRKINEDKEEYHSSNPVNVDEFIEKDEGEYI